MLLFSLILTLSFSLCQNMQPSSMRTSSVQPHQIRLMVPTFCASATVCCRPAYAFSFAVPLLPLSQDDPPLRLSPYFHVQNTY
uniref:Secreted protein n=1 Tax=Setaria viridis TaxID=4556 RepID=A0A4U6UE61_SETVI|nr:hypothetical protein SEVIR_5G162001v2 [Setaria viridis]